ncbi:MAG: NAD-dependent deacetylase [Actinomycetaceae bacterium]|nr:NAD-dependent deacetylase [Actinomycetaceae bacterium]
MGKQVEALAEMMSGGAVLAVTGAGISTDAGIPDYRGEGRKEEPSVYFDQFENDPVWQRWVWQRNEETWRSVAALKPTEGHKALVTLEKAGLLVGVATQNVDNLHSAAGSTNVAELHGSFMRVVCLQCRTVFPRDGIVNDIIQSANPNITLDPDPAHAAVLASADRPQAEKSTFTVPLCPNCGGLLKPDIIFFGESLPGEPLEKAFDMARRADFVLVAGSSMYVQTGVWVVREALAHGARLGVVNRGVTAVDNIADIRIEGGCSEVLSEVAAMLVQGKDM